MDLLLKFDTPLTVFQLFRRLNNATKDYASDSMMATLPENFWSHCTPEVMSGDESDTEWKGPKDQLPHFVSVLSWRNPEVVGFFRVLDALYFSTHFKDNKWSPGRFPHTRVPSLRVKHSDAVPGLPVNFYNPTWLAQLSDIEKRKLKMKEILKLDFSVHILRWALIPCITFCKGFELATGLVFGFSISDTGSNCLCDATILQFWPCRTVGLFHPDSLYQTCPVPQLNRDKPSTLLRLQCYFPRLTQSSFVPALWIIALQAENTNPQQPSLPISHLPTLSTEATGAGSPFVLFPTSGSSTVYVPQLYVLQQGEAASHLLYPSGSQGGVPYPTQFAVAVNAPMVNPQEPSTTSTNFGNGGRSTRKGKERAY